MEKLKEKSLPKKSRYCMTGTKESVRIATVIEVMQGARRDEVAKKYGVDPTSISHWKRIFAERSEIKSLIAMNRIKSKRLQSLSSMQTESRSHQSEELATLNRQLLEQEKEIVDLHQRLDIANTIIEVAEKLFHIEIKKKLGSNQ